MTEYVLDRVMLVVVCVLSFAMMYLFVVKYEESLVLDVLSSRMAIEQERDMVLYELEERLNSSD